MGKQVVISGFMYEADFAYGEKEYRFFVSDRMADENYTLIGPHEFTYEVPANFNPVACKLAALEKEKQAVRAAYLAKVREIEERIGKLQALEMTVEA